MYNNGSRNNFNYRRRRKRYSNWRGPRYANRVLSPREVEGLKRAMAARALARRGRITGGSIIPNELRTSHRYVHQGLYNAGVTSQVAYTALRITQITNTGSDYQEANNNVTGTTYALPLGIGKMWELYNYGVVTGARVTVDYVKESDNTNNRPAILALAISDTTNPFASANNVEEVLSHKELIRARRYIGSSDIQDNNPIAWATFSLHKDTQKYFDFPSSLLPMSENICSSSGFVMDFPASIYALVIVMAPDADDDPGASHLRTTIDYAVRWYEPIFL